MLAISRLSTSVRPCSGVRYSVVWLAWLAALPNALQRMEKARELSLAVLEDARKVLETPAEAAALAKVETDWKADQEALNGMLTLRPQSDMPQDSPVLQYLRSNLVQPSIISLAHRTVNALVSITHICLI